MRVYTQPPPFIFYMLPLPSEFRFPAMETSIEGSVGVLCGSQHPFATYHDGLLPLADGQRKLRQQSSHFGAIGQQIKRPCATQFT